MATSIVFTSQLQLKDKIMVLCLQAHIKMFGNFFFFLKFIYIASAFQTAFPSTNCIESQATIGYAENGIWEGYII